MTFNHKSVLLNETIESLNIHPDGIYVDGTLGGAGHSSEICKRLGTNGMLIGIDQDGDAIVAASERLKEFGDKVTIVRDNYVNTPSVLANLGIRGVDGILLDLGVSSYQLDTDERGFSYQHEAPLDMRLMILEKCPVEERRRVKSSRNVVIRRSMRKHGKRESQSGRLEDLPEEQLLQKVRKPLVTS